MLVILLPSWAEQAEGTGIAVQVGGMANGSNFAAAEKTGQGDMSHAVKKGFGFVVGLRKKTLAAAGAGKEQRPAGAAALGAVFL